mmetsp:Transcript_139091/g.444239  ORF Transcript_139091/g.444239 Transcript_139091/m.444239 type:complete len:268 (-) Transcript_139091:529-1332(-)
MLTRARRGLVVFGSASTLRNDAHWQRWLAWCEAHGAVYGGLRGLSGPAVSAPSSAGDGAGKGAVEAASILAALGARSPPTNGRAATPAQPRPPPPPPATAAAPPPPLQSAEKPRPSSALQDFLGLYIMQEQAGVTSDAPAGSAMIGRVEKGMRVRALEVVHCPGEQRVRARIAEPAGWISLLDTSDGYRWAVRADGAAGHTSSRSLAQQLDVAQIVAGIRGAAAATAAAAKRAAPWGLQPPMSRPPLDVDQVVAGIRQAAVAGAAWG